MGHVEHSAIGDAPVDFAFEYVADYQNVPKWMFGVKRFTPLGTQTRGLGAKFDTALNLGPTTLNLHAEVTEWVADRLITLYATKGIEATMRWTFAPIDATTTRIRVVADYKVPGGLAGRALDKIIQAFVGPAIRFTEKHLREQIQTAYRTSLDEAG